MIFGFRSREELVRVASNQAMPVPVISVAQMREWEKATWAARRTPAQVISRVGHIVTSRVRQLTRPGDLIVILAGKGHNGDDARQTGQNLSGHEVTLLNVLDPAAALKEFNSQLSMRPTLIVDGLFGIGLNRPLEAPWVKLIEKVNQSQIPVLAIDVPSGLNADTGEPEGAAIRATITLTLGTPKKGLLESCAWPFVGRLEVAPDIGLVPCPHEGGVQWTLPEDFDNFPPPRPVDGHKGTFGHLVIVAGSLGYHGAAVLAAHGALRAQPGLVTLLVQESVYLPVASRLNSAMVRPWSRELDLPDSCSAILFGPGLAARDVPADLKRELRHLWEELPLPVIADASALDWLPAGATPPKSIRVMTPHPGEAGRLLKLKTAEIQTQRLATLRKLSKQYGNNWVVLKGHQTLVGRSKGDVFFNSSGNPLLAQGGSGDALAGYLGGLLAQPQLQADPTTAIRYGVWQHGAAADLLSAERTNWTVENLLDALGNRKKHRRQD
ncbi:MAG: NAD(P)H-hydrate dehydratase [Verrucomicrobia bacterium]|nr:MAG: NAD(P)H-hydrate dehydratase [Verrucomicrobiota bacterium]